MADLTTLRHSPLEGLGNSGGEQVRLRELPFATMVSVRVDPNGAAAAALERALGTALPRTVGQVAEHGHHYALWLGPDEWLVISEVEPAPLVTTMSAAVEGAHASCVDVSANRTILELTGPAARSVLAKGGPDAIDGGAWNRLYVFQRYTSIGAGTTEVQKNIISDKAIKLPRAR